MNPIHEANREQWDSRALEWEARSDSRGIWNRCSEQPDLALHPLELDLLREVAGTDVCVLGSGDNQVVFALASLGARVTSVDISDEQLAVARKRARLLDLSVTFLRADVTDLAALADETFDFVYTGGHVAVWVSDLQLYYREAVRILNTGGLFIVSEYHPFRRPWRSENGHLDLAVSYFDRGPHIYDADEKIQAASADSLKQYEFHWTVSDYVSALMAAGCELLSLDEFGEAPEDWEDAPLAGLPQTLLLVGKKR